jgi:hypothetical protein
MGAPGPTRPLLSPNYGSAAPLRFGGESHSRTPSGRRDGGVQESVPVSALDAAMARLRAAERERRPAIDDLIGLGAIRSHVLVGDLIAARYYGVELPPAFTPGYDLVDQRGNRVQVKTLRATPTRPRTIIGEVKDPCDLVLAIRLDFDYAPTEAIEIPRAVAGLFVGKNGNVSWTAKLGSHPQVRSITAVELVAGRGEPAG